MKRDINNEKGFTLIEVLVALFLLSVGMMSAASMQTTAISGNKFSKDTSLAIELAEEMVDRIRINGGNSPHEYDGIDTTGTGNCSSYTGKGLVKNDCDQWKLRMEHDNLGLRNAIGIVNVDPQSPDNEWSNGVPIPRTATIEVEIRWQSGGGNSWMLKERSVKIVTIVETWVG